jgi:type VI protein secretion system component VasK
MENGIGFWEGFFLLIIFIPLVMVWVFALMDLFRRDDLKGWVIALWIAALILLPFLGALIYFLVRPVTAGDVEQQKAYVEEVESEKAARAADKLHKLSELKDKGDITQEQFEKQKAKLLKD